MSSKKISSLLKDARDKCGVSQAVLADAAGVSTRTVSRLESGNPSTEAPRNNVIIALALATNSDPNKWLSVVGRTASPEAIQRARLQIRDTKLDIGAPSSGVKRILEEMDILPILKEILADQEIEKITFSNLKKMIQIKIRMRELQDEAHDILKK